MKTFDVFKKTVFIINPNTGAIESMTYKDYCCEYGCGITTTPGGVAPILHIREKYGFFYQNVETKKLIEKCDYDYLEDDEQGNYRSYGESIVSWELWSWGFNGNNPIYIDSYKSEEEAELALLERFESNALNSNDNAPFIYESEQDAIDNII